MMRDLAGWNPPVNPRDASANMNGYRLRGNPDVIYVALDC